MRFSGCMPGGGGRRKPVWQRVRIVAACVMAPWAAWGALVSTVCVVAEIASEPTWEQGVDSSTWTPVRGVAALVAGAEVFGGDFDAPSIAGGLVALAVYRSLPPWGRWAGHAAYGATLALVTAAVLHGGRR